MLPQKHKSQTRLGWSLKERDPQFIKSLMPSLGFLYRYYFRVQTSGWDHIPSQEKVLFVGSHNGGLAAPDMSMVMYDWFRKFGYDKAVYGLMHSHVWQFTPEIAKMAARAGAAFDAGQSDLIHGICC